MAIVQCHLFCHKLERIPSLFRGSLLLKTFLLVNLESSLHCNCLLTETFSEYIYKAYWSLGAANSKFSTAHGAIQMLKRNPSRRSLFHLVLQALGMVNMTTAQCNAGLGAKFYNVTYTTHVSLEAVNERSLLIQNRFWHIHHVLGLDRHHRFAAWYHAGEALGCPFDTFACMSTFKLFAAKLIGSPITLLVYYMLLLRIWLDHLNAIASKLVHCIVV